MKTTGSLLVAAVALFDVALAHYRFTSLISNGTITGQYQYVRQNTNDNSPITDVTSDDIRCNQGTLPYGPSTSVATVVAGTSVGFELDIPIYHPGPLAVYMSKVTSGFTIQTYDGSGPWFKIAELGATITPTAINFLSMNLGSYNFTIPPTTPPGEYLLRIEQIGLHVAETVGGAQFYLSCAQVQVNGPGGGTPGPTILLPGGYNANDPGLVIDIYYPIPQSYVPPGPAVWPSGDTGASGTTPIASAPTTAPVGTSTLSTVVKSTSVVTTVKPTSTSTGATQALYGQCGGIGWTGPTVCAAPATCQVTNTYYSQCLD